MLVAIKPNTPVKPSYTAPVYVLPEVAARLVLEGKATLIASEPRV